MRTPRIVLLLVFALLLAVPAQAERSTAYGSHKVHYIAYNSTFLDPEVASRYEINRAKNRGVINVSVQAGDVVAEGVVAEITGTVTNLMHQIKTLQLREIREGKAIYYVGDFNFDDEDVLTFKLKVNVKGEPRPLEFDWQQKFWR